jgi:invasion protein IalB
MKLVHYKRIASGTTIAAAAAVGFQGGVGLNLFNSAGWGVPPSYAQTNTPARAPAAKPPAPASTPTATQRTERTVFDAWTVTCSETVEKTSKKMCSAMLQMVEEKQQQVLLVWVIGRDNQGVMRTVIQSPTGIQIPKGVEIKFGVGPARTMAYTICTPKACEASMAVDDAMARDATASQEATATIVLVDGRSVNFKIGIKGLDKALVALGK